MLFDVDKLFSNTTHDVPDMSEKANRSPLTLILLINFKHS